MSAPAVASDAPPPRVNNDAPPLQEHMLGTYHGLRLGVGAIGVALPWVLWLGGLWRGQSLMDSMSAYYHSPMRDAFVGALCAIAFLLYVYKGFSDRENYALNTAAVLAIGVAMFPTMCPAEVCPDVTTRDAIGWIHLGCAVLFFMFIAYVSIRCAPATLSLIHDPKKRRWYKQAYRITGWAMVALPILAMAMALSARLTSYLFFVEAAGVTAFAAFWFVKSSEMRLTDADELAAEGVLKEAVPPDTKGRLRMPDFSQGRLVVTSESLWPEEIAEAEAEARTRS